MYFCVFGGKEKHSESNETFTAFCLTKLYIDNRTEVSPKYTPIGTLNKWNSSHDLLKNTKSNPTQLKPSSTFSSGDFGKSVEDLKPDITKPVLKAWANKAKSHSASRLSKSTENLDKLETKNWISKVLENTPWGKLYKPRNSKSCVELTAVGIVVKDIPIEPSEQNKTHREKRNGENEVLTEAVTTKKSESTEAVTTNKSESTEAVTTKKSESTEAETTKQSESTEAETTKQSESTETETTKQSESTEAETTKKSESTEAETTKQSESTEAETTKKSESTDAETTKESENKVGIVKPVSKENSYIDKVTSPAVIDTSTNTLPESIQQRLFSCSEELLENKHNLDSFQNDQVFHSVLSNQLDSLEKEISTLENIYPIKLSDHKSLTSLVSRSNCNLSESKLENTSDKDNTRFRPERDTSEVPSVNEANKNTKESFNIESVNKTRKGSNCSTSSVVSIDNIHYEKVSSKNSSSKKSRRFSEQNRNVVQRRKKISERSKSYTNLSTAYVHENFIDQAKSIDRTIFVNEELNKLKRSSASSLSDLQEANIDNIRIKKVYTDLNDQITETFRRRKTSAPEKNRNAFFEEHEIIAEDHNLKDRDVTENICKQTKAAEPPQDVNRKKNHKQISSMSSDKIAVDTNNSNTMDERDNSFDRKGNSESYFNQEYNYKPLHNTKPVGKVLPQERNMERYSHNRTSLDEYTYAKYNNIADKYSKYRSYSYSGTTENQTTLKNVNSYTGITNINGEPFIPKSAYLRKRLEDINKSCSTRSSEMKTDFTDLNTKSSVPVSSDSLKANISTQNSLKDIEKLPESSVTTVKLRSYSAPKSINKVSVSNIDPLKRYSEDSGILCNSSPKNSASDSDDGDFKLDNYRLSQDSGIFRANQEIIRQDEPPCTIESEFVRNIPLHSSEIDYKKSEDSVKNGRSMSLNVDSKSEVNLEVQQLDKVTTKSKTLGSIVKVTSSKISGVDELKSFSHRRRNKQRISDASSNIQGKDRNDSTEHLNEEDNKSGKQSNNKEPLSPKAEKQSRKHSISNFLGFRKDKDSSSHNEVKKDEEKISEQPTSPQHKEHKSSKIYRLFHKKSEDIIEESVEPEKTVEVEKDVEKPKTSIKQRVSKSLSITVKSQKNEKDENKPREIADVPSKPCDTSEPSVASEIKEKSVDTPEPSSNKKYSKNKERIRQRKAAKLEALEAKSNLEAMTAAVNNVNTNNANDKENITPKSPRKKQRARRSNTEIIVSDVRTAMNQELVRDDGIVMRRNNKRNVRNNRAETLTNGLDLDLMYNKDKLESGVVQENMSFAEIKNKLLQGLPENKATEEATPDVIPAKERQKIKRTKSTKRYKTITEGIAPRDIELARQAFAATQNGENGESTSETNTLDKLNAALSSNNEKRKSYLVEEHGAGGKEHHHSAENLQAPSTELSASTQNINKTPKHKKKSATIKRTKSMSTINMMSLTKKKDEEEEEEEGGEEVIKPLSEMKNRFLQAMEDTKQKHLAKKTPIDLTGKGRPRKDRPHTICSLDDWTKDKLSNDIENGLQNGTSIEAEKNLINKLEHSDKAKKKVKRRYTGAQSEKLFEELFNDLEDIVNEGLSEKDLAKSLGVNPSLSYSTPDINKQEMVKENTKRNSQLDLPAVNETKEPTEPVSDLDFVSNQTTRLSSAATTDRRNVRPQRRHRTGANPVKALQQRQDLVDENTIQDPSKQNDRKKFVLEDFKAKKATKGPNQRDLAEEAISALRTKVDFTKAVKLRKVEVGVKKEEFAIAEGVPVSTFTHLMVQVKGRRKVQTTVVPFSKNSLNNNDCYLLVTPRDLVCWSGSQANVIEKAKAAEIASRIVQKKEMGCKAGEVAYAEQGSGSESKALRVLKEQETEDSLVSPRHLEDIGDEEYEKMMTSAYMTYTVAPEEEGVPARLVTVDSQCHHMPSKDILKTNAVFVFDFIDEVYVWLGQQTGSQLRKTTQKLAAEKFEEGYYALSPDTISVDTTSRRISVATQKEQHTKRVSVEQGRHQTEERVARSLHALLLVMFEKSELVIFREKFSDWPDESRIIRLKGGPVGEIKPVSTEVKINTVDPTSMVVIPPLPKLVLESYDLGRGRGIPKGMDGYHVLTLDVKTWFVSENNSILMPDESFGQFHSGEGYVIRWQYRIVKVRALRGLDDPLKAGGIERCCYFFWLGNDCSVNEEGATAVMTLELDKEKGPQQRVVLGKEPTSLLQLYDGGMVIHAGKRPAPGLRTAFTDPSLMRLYCVRGELVEEACLLQIPATCESLRSRSSFVMLLCAQGEVFLWHGCRSNEGTRASAEHAAKQLIANHPKEASIEHMKEIGLTEVEEGHEPEAFWIALGGKEDYGSLLNDTSDVGQLSPRLFQLESTTDTFVAHEILCTSRTDQHNCPFPVLQDDLYNVEQPGIFMLDSGVHVYLWFGWWPEEEEIGESASKTRRWDEERKKAMESTLLYAQEVAREEKNLFVVYAGLEPESFIELFPYWVVQHDITEIQLDMGIDNERLYTVTEELSTFTREFYSIDELREKPPPQGVDPTKLEKYLSEEDFFDAFEFAKETFYKLPGWQQVNWKKKLGLY